MRRPPSFELLGLYLETDRRLAVALVGGTLLSAGLAPGLALATGALAGQLGAGQGAMAMLLLVGALFTVQRLLEPVQEQIAKMLARRVDERLATRVMAAIARPPGLSHVEDPAVLDAIAKADGALIGVTPGKSATRFGWVHLQRVQGALALGIVASWRWWAVLPLVAAYLAAFRLSRWHWHEVSLIIYGRADHLRRAHYLRTLALTSTVAKETRVFGLAPWLVDRYRHGWLAVMGDIWRKRQEGWLAALAIYTAVGGAEIFVLLTLARDGVAGTASLAQAVAVANAVLMAGGLGLFNDSHWYLGEAVTALGQVRKLEQLTGGPGAVVGGTRDAAGLPARVLRCEGVRFTYPGRTEPVFDGLDLEIPAGRSLAIVGENGAGKTTLVKLLCRLYDPDAGRISVDDIDLRTLAPAAWHRRVAAIFQDFTQFELTAHDNVAFGALDRRDDQAEVTRAAELAGASAIVDRLAQGWNTPLSRQFKGGTQLSGGEWQRLALARALFAVRAGAGLLVLDEPTAALDARGEAEVYERFLQLTRGVTSIVISHRFSTVRRADHIVVLEHGRVVEQGSHAALVAAGGRYATMYRLQAARFDGAGPEANADA